MTVAARYIHNPRDFWPWLIEALDAVPNPKSRDPDFLYDVTAETLEKYRELARDSQRGGAANGSFSLPDGKQLKKLVMSRAFEKMRPDDRGILVRIWAHQALTSAGKGTAPSDEFIEFIEHLLRISSELRLERSVMHVRRLSE